jgi:hypothetical protein
MDVKEDEMGGACCTHGGGEIEGFGWETWRKETTLNA